MDYQRLRKPVAKKKTTIAAIEMRKRPSNIKVNHNLQRVVNDINIWYYFGEGQLKPSDYPNYNFIGTYTNILEAAKTENNLINPEKLKEAIRSMIKTPAYMYYKDPFAHAISILKNEDVFYVPIKTSFMIYTEAVANGLELSSEEDRIKYTEFMNDIKSKYETIAEGENLIISNIKANYQNIEEIRSFFGYEQSKSVLIKYLKDQPESKGLDFDKADFSKLELFINTQSKFYETIATHKQEMKIKLNDLIDLMNLLYVQPGDLYFTNDGPWLKHIKNADMEHYLLGKEVMHF